MRAKKEKTEFGSVKAVIPKKKKVVYGTVVPPVKIDHSKDGEESTIPPTMAIPVEPEDDTTSMGDSTETLETADMSEEQYDASVEEEQRGKEYPEEQEATQEESGEDTMEKLQKLIESMEDYAKQKAQEEEKKKEEEQKEQEEEAKSPKSEEEKKEHEQKKQKQEQEDKLTKYLTLQLRIIALGELFGAVKIAEKDKEYFSFKVVEGATGFVTYGIQPYEENTILAFSIFPYFESKEDVEAFTELCGDMLIDYCHLAYNLNAQSIGIATLKVSIVDLAKE
jgi:flagellar biosynthesis GTPase FlhF